MGERAKFLMNLIDSSEMACSLRYEDMGGCPYNTFTPRGIAALSSISVVSAIVSLVFGM